MRTPQSEVVFFFSILIQLILLIRSIQKWSTLHRSSVFLKGKPSYVYPCPIRVYWLLNPLNGFRNDVDGLWRMILLKWFSSLLLLFMKLWMHLYVWDLTEKRIKHNLDRRFLDVPVTPLTSDCLVSSSHLSLTVYKDPNMYILWSRITSELTGSCAFTSNIYFSVTYLYNPLPTSRAGFFCKCVHVCARVWLVAGWAETSKVDWDRKKRAARDTKWY